MLSGLIVLSLFSARLKAEDITLGCTNWLPFVNEQLPGYGAVMEIVSEALARKGITSIPVTMPWARVLDMGEKGELLVACVWYTPQREEKFLFSRPFLVNRIPFLKRSDTRLSWQTLSDLKHLSFVVERKASYGPEFDQSVFLTKHPVTDITQQIQMVLNHRVDLAPIAEGAAHYHIDALPAHQRQQLNFSARSLIINKLYIMFSRSHPEHEKIIAAFNEGLEEMQQDHTYSDILRRYNLLRFQYPSSPEVSATNPPLLSE